VTNVESGEAVRRLGTRARRVRAVALASMVALLVAGNQFGEDDHFPFAPMRMYAHKTTGRVKELKLVGTTAAGIDVPVRFSECRLRRAEAAGQTPRFAADPSLLRHLADAYERARPGAPRLESLRLLYVIYPLTRDGRPSGETERTVATWSRA
jgi:hypothetical protein